MASVDAIKAGEAVVSASLDDRQLRAGLARIQGRFQAFAQQLKRLAGVGLSLGVAMAPVASTFLKFDDAIRMVKAVTGATADEFDRLQENALLLGRTTSFTAAEVATLMGELGKAGFKPDEINAMTKAVLDLARATGTDATVASGFMAATLRQFSLGAKEATRVADALTVAANLSFNSVVDLGEALKYAGPVAADLGMSLEDTLAVLGALGNVGIQGEMAGTTMRRLSLLLATGDEGLQKVFGVKSVDEFGNVRQMVDVMADIFKATADLPTGERMEKFAGFFKILGVTGASAISKNVANVRELREALENAAGTAAETAREMDAGLGGSWRRLKGAAEGAAIALGEMLAPALALVAGMLQAAAGGIVEWVGRNRELATGIGAVAVALIALAAAGASVLVLGFLFTAALAPVMALWAGLKLVFAGILLLKSPALIVFAAIAAGLLRTEQGTRAVAAVVARAGEAMRGMGEAFTEAFGGIVAAVRKGDLQLAWDIAIKGMHVAYLDMVKGLRGAWFDFCNFFRDAFRDAVLSIGRFALRVVGGIQTGFLDAVTRIIEGLNRAHALVTGGDQPGYSAITAKVLANPEFRRLSDELDAEVKIREGHEAKLKEIQDRTRARQARIAELEAAGTDPNQVTVLKSVQDFDRGVATKTAQQIEASVKHAAAVSAQFGRLRQEAEEELRAGNKFINPAPFREARRQIETEVEGRIQAIEALDKAEREARNRGQEARLAEIQKERDQLFAELKELTRLANMQTAPMPRLVGGLPVAPMPHRPGGRSSEERFGDAVRGLFQSADFRGALSIGPANEQAAKQLDATKGIETALRDYIGPKLDAIERKIEPGVFT